MRRLLCIALLAGACGPADGDPAPRADGSVPGGAPLAGQDCLIVLLDALHAERLGCHGGRAGVSPALDALAGEGVRFSQARSNASWTLPSTTTLFTGLYQETHGIHFDVDFEKIRLDEGADTLAELFAEAGYDTAYLNQNPFSGRSYGLDQGFADYREFNEFTGTPDAVLRGALELLARPAQRPRFTYIHFRKPHTPFDAPPELRDGLVDATYAGKADGSEAQISDHNLGKRKLGPDDLAHHAALYDANIRQVDAWVGQLLAAVDPSRTLVLVLSDHGEAVGQHAVLGHNWYSWEEYIRIPLIFRHPALPGGRVLDAPVSTVDLLPTLRELFGLRAPAQGEQGVGFAPLLLGAQATLPDRPVFSSSRLLRGRQDSAVVAGGWKYIRTEPGAREQLYDLRADPAERRNLAASPPPGVLEALRERLLAWKQGQRRTWVAPAEELDDATLERLRQLGYIR